MGLPEKTTDHWRQSFWCVNSIRNCSDNDLANLSDSITTNNHSNLQMDDEAMNVLTVGL